MSKIISCYGLVSSFRVQTMLARQFSCLVSTNSDRISNFKRKSQLYMLNSSRTLYTDNALGISKLDRLREQKSQLFAGPTRDRYLERLSDFLKVGDVEAIYKDDLVNLIAIANDEKDLDLIEQVVIKSRSNNNPFLKGWGALLARLYYKMNTLDRIYNNIKDVDTFGDFFNLRSCYKILMTMLYDAKRYDAVMEIFQLSQERLKQSETQNDDDLSAAQKDLCAIVFAALARINNPEALDKAEVLYNKLNTSPKGLGLRPVSFCAYIACSNDKPKLALNLISNASNRNYISLRELKVASLIKLGRYEDILLQLREYVANIKRESNLLLKSTYDMIQNNSNQIQDPAISQELSDLLLEIKQNGHVSDTTIEELLFKPIDTDRPPLRVNRNFGFDQGRNMSRNRYTNNDRYQDDLRNNNRYQSRSQPQNNYGHRQHYNNQSDYNQQRSSRRYNDNRGDNDDFGRGDNDKQRKRFTYQNMNLD